MRNHAGPNPIHRWTRRQLGVAVAAISVVVLIALLGHRSQEPWFFGRYSLAYTVFLALVVSAFGFISALFFRFGLKAGRLPAAWAIVLVAALATIEGIAQLYASRHPSYHVLFLQPDPVLG